MKQRFSAIDVRATVASLKEKIIGLRLQNVYDINAKTYLFKFSKPEHKELVLIESGIRLHSTQFAREKNQIPSGFCTKLRKHIRTRRLTNIQQLGVDRIVDFEFGGENKGYHIIAEFYAAGNIILTDENYVILSLLRVVQPNESTRMAVGEVYDVSSVARTFEPITLGRLQNCLASAGPKDTLKKVLSFGLDYGQAMVEHVLLMADINPGAKVATEIDSTSDSPQMEALLKAFLEADRMILDCGKTTQKGYIILKKHEKRSNELEDGESKEFTTYDEFHPFALLQHSGKPTKEFASFDEAVDEFFSALESQKLELKQRQQEDAALKKLDAVRRDHEERIKALEGAQLSNVRRAQLIEANLAMVDAAILILRNAIASGMDWLDLEALVENERRNGNPIALMISGLKLETNQITLLLSDQDAQEESEADEDELFDDSETEDAEKSKSKQKPVVEAWKVDIDIGLSAFANARRFYEQKKQSAVKQEKTLAASEKALKSAQRKVLQDIKETRTTVRINKIRKPYWFEKFLWFISSENYLVIAGRDAQQNEQLVKRYFRKGDLYVHADLHGAASVIVKNPSGGEVPPSTMFQAGVMSVCQSKAWEAKIVTSAYWVTYDQVSKTAPTGEYLTTGSFMIRGKKNFLPPVQLVYGFGLLFRVDESCIARHIGERRTLAALGDEEIVEEREGPEKIVREPQNRDIFGVRDGEQEQEIEPEEKSEDEEMRVEDEREHKAEGEANSEDLIAPKEEDTSKIGEGEKETPPTLIGQLQNLSLESTAQTSAKDDTFEDEEFAFPDTQVELSTWDKYNLSEYGQNDLEEEEEEPQQDDKHSTSKKKHMSAKERRQQKKQRLGIAVEEERTSSSLSGHSGTDSEKKSKATPVPVARGKKGKLKKLKEKYADQDEEEREIRMQLLGSSKGPQPKGKKAKKEAERKAQMAQKQNQKQQPHGKRNEGKQKETEKSQTAVEEAPEYKASHTDEQLDDVHTDQDRQEIHRIMKEENIPILEAEDAENMSFLDALTGIPHPDDTLLYAVPVCAPYSALQKYKYKVKLTPGTMKKGKAVNTAIHLFLNLSDENNQERDLIKSIPETELISSMMGKCKVSAPNIETMKKKKKMSGKKKAQAA
ncbi:uncharacterized protein VTP21DRAFT_5436 [Calcarisporiella thermophila]|uniref:uncharacterized protein n=1 Tax=Calcarisporiella thermophila TaxID=911321 RepID=UPI003743D8D2